MAIQIGSNPAFMRPGQVNCGFKGPRKEQMSHMAHNLMDGIRRFFINKYHNYNTY